MRLLVLGGTVFLGRAIARAALSRGHAVTCFARGSAAPPDGVEFVRGDRDADDGLAPVARATWDAVIDVARQPVHVRRAVRDLRTPHHVFVSTANVYAHVDVVEQDEDAERIAPLEADVMADPDDYGAAKVACEDAVTAAGGTATLLRAALIGGFGDATGRSGYWPWRFAHPTADDVLVPDAPDALTAVLDARNLADFAVLAAEQRLDGAFNTAGVTTPLADALAAAAVAAGSTARARPVPEDALLAAGVGQWMGPTSMPLWIAEPEARGAATLDTARARAAGLVLRRLEDTFRDALAWEEERGGPRGAGLTDDDERRLRRIVADSDGPEPRA